MGVRPSRRARGPGPAATPAAAPVRCLGRTALARERIRHAATLLGRNLLQTRPPLRDVGRREPILGAQQQQVVAGAKARLLEQTERTPPAGMLEPRLQREHLAHAERKARMGFAVAGSI